VRFGAARLQSLFAKAKKSGLARSDSPALSSSSSEATAEDRHGRVVRESFAARAAVRQRLVAANHQAGERNAPGTVVERSAPPQCAAHDGTPRAARPVFRYPENA
jgi:hypothetical protein